ncbi:predicted protein [Lichtheimia corymbifera JMRC:FSU:9682]|uniref:Uncharacterized protein n=1 Tax=Lichtheimia corymbifera JMRC:FSU:9682 TaxID=1263082 RepID=A0A068RK62_9FUNG|nr:predicted protein [Lichtheimia corymbifera JMRC:FSU:9682]
MRKCFKKLGITMTLAMATKLYPNYAFRSAIHVTQCLSFFLQLTKNPPSDKKLPQPIRDVPEKAEAANLSKREEAAIKAILRRTTTLPQSTNNVFIGFDLLSAGCLDILITKIPVAQLSRCM